MTHTSFGIPLHELEDWRDEGEHVEAEHAARIKQEGQDIEEDRKPFWQRQNRP